MQKTWKVKQIEGNSAYKYRYNNAETLLQIAVKGTQARSSLYEKENYLFPCSYDTDLPQSSCLWLTKPTATGEQQKCQTPSIFKANQYSVKFPRSGKHHENKDKCYTGHAVYTSLSSLLLTCNQFSVLGLLLLSPLLF